MRDRRVSAEWERRVAGMRWQLTGWQVGQVFGIAPLLVCAALACAVATLRWWWCFPIGVLLLLAALDIGWRAWRWTQPGRVLDWARWCTALRDRHDLYTLTPAQFDLLVRYWYVRQGYPTTPCPLLAPTWRHCWQAERMDGSGAAWALIACMQHRGQVTHTLVEQLAIEAARCRIPHVILVTSGVFTGGAALLAAQLDVELVDGAELTRRIQMRQRIAPPSPSLADRVLARVSW